MLSHPITKVNSPCRPAPLEAHTNDSSFAETHVWLHPFVKSTPDIHRYGAVMLSLASNSFISLQLGANLADGIPWSFSLVIIGHCSAVINVQRFNCPLSLTTFGEGQNPSTFAL